MADVTRTIEIEVQTKDAVKSIDKLNEELQQNEQATEKATDQQKK